MKTKMRVYRDPNTGKDFEIMKYKGSEFEVGAFYCPQIPLAMSGQTVNPDTMMPPPEVEQVSNDPFVFRLRCDGDVYLPRAERAFHWVMENVPKKDRLFENEAIYMTHLHSTSNTNVLVTIHTAELATLFKMFCM